MRLNRPEISVIIPVYNAEQYIRECLDSILTQSFRDIEVICVDDGSTDQSPAILNEYSNKDNRVRVITQKNMKAGKARNTGFKNAWGKYVIFLDADDYFKEELLSDMYACIEKNNTDVVLCDAFFLNNNTKDIMNFEFGLHQKYIPSNDIFSPDDVKETLFQISTCVAWNKLCRAEFIRKSDIHFTEGTGNSEDNEFSLQVMCAAEKIGIVNKKLIVYRAMNPESLEGKKQDVEGLARTYTEMKDIIETKYGFQKYERTYINNVVEDVVNALATISNLDSYKKLYNVFKSEIVEMFELEKRDIDYFHNPYNYKKLMNIIQYNSTEYLLLEARERKLRADEMSSKKIWKFPYEKIPQGSRVALYGYGQVGRDYVREMKLTNYANLVCCVDQNWRDYLNHDIRVISMDALSDVTFDYIVIAIANHYDANIIKNELENIGIETNKIVGAYL